MIRRRRRSTFWFSEERKKKENLETKITSVPFSLESKQRKRKTCKRKIFNGYMYIHGKWNICMAPHTPSTEAIDVRRALQMAYREPGTYIHGCHDDDAKTYAWCIYVCIACHGIMLWILEMHGDCIYNAYIYIKTNIFSGETWGKINEAMVKGMERRGEGGIYGDLKGKN